MAEDDKAHCTVCNADVPAGEFLKHFRECMRKKKETEAPKVASTTPQAPKASAANSNMSRAAALRAEAHAEAHAEAQEVSQADFGEDFAAAMGLEGGDLDAGAFPKKKRVIRWKPLSEMTYEERRRYEMSKVKDAWRGKHLRDPEIRECGEQYLEWYENGGPGVEACAHCRFYYPEHKVHRHEQTCPERPVEEPEAEYVFDPTAPVRTLTKQHIDKLSRSGQLESNPQQLATQGSQRPHSTARGWRTGSRKDPRPLSVQRAETAARRAGDPYTHDERPVHNRMPANRHWIQTVPATIKVLEQVTDFIALDRAKVRHEWLQDQLAKEEYRREKRRMQPRPQSPSPPTQSQGSRPGADSLPETEFFHSVGETEAWIQARRELMEEVMEEALQPPSPRQRPFDPELSVQAARRKAVLAANQTGDVHYPYSDQPMLDDEVYANMNQRTAALQAQANRRQELLMAAHQQVERVQEHSLVRYYAPAPAPTRVGTHPHRGGYLPPRGYAQAGH